MREIQDWFWRKPRRLRGAELTGTDNANRWFLDADLREADLSDAIVDGANLEGADLRGASIKNAHIAHANLCDVK